MKVEKYRVLGELLEVNKKQFIIPVYQRNYDWKRENCKKLFDDVVAAFEKDKFHFLGSIVFVALGEENKINKYLIIDGQQRITTLFLLLKAMHDAADTQNDREKLHDILFNEDRYGELDLTEQTKVKLKPIKSDNNQFLSLMNDEISAMDKKSGIYVNYLYFKGLVQKTVARGISVRDILAGIGKLISAVITLEPEDDPQGVFESINSTGVSLSLADKIRNYVLMTDGDRERLYDKYWLKTENNVTTEKTEAFITDYLTFACKENVTEANAYSAFKNLFVAKCYTNEKMLAELLHYSEFYKAFLFGDDRYSAIVNKRLMGLRALDQGTIYPFLFRVFDDLQSGKITEKTAERVLTFFLDYLLRRIVCGVPSNSLRGLFKTLYNRIFDDTEIADYYDAIVLFFMQLNTNNAVPTDSALKDALMNADLYNKKKVCKYILKAIEHMTNDGTESKEPIDISNLTIEHIMPQALTEQWKSELGADYARVHEKYLHNLGNLSLTGYNSELGQKPFKEKKQMIADKNSHIVVLNKDVLSAEVWNEQAMIARADRLSGIVIKLFPIEKPVGDYETVGSRVRRLSIGENFDATGTKPLSFVFAENNVLVGSYAELLSKAMILFYEYDGGVMEQLATADYKMPNAVRTYITNDPSLLRRAEEIGDSGIFYENNLSANNITAFLRCLIEEFGLDGDDFVICVK